jgi:hypothetical protein
MRTVIAINLAGMTGLLALSGASLAACAHEEPWGADVRPQEIGGGWSASRQVAVRVETDGSVAWEGRAVSREELETLMRQAALSSPKLLLVVVPVSDQVRYGEVLQIVQMASMYGIETEIGETGGSAE